MPWVDRSAAAESESGFDCVGFRKTVYSSSPLHDPQTTSRVIAGSGRTPSASFAAETSLRSATRADFASVIDSLAQNLRLLWKTSILSTWGSSKNAWR